MNLKIRRCRDGDMKLYDFIRKRGFYSPDLGRVQPNAPGAARSEASAQATQ